MNHIQLQFELDRQVFFNKEYELTTIKSEIVLLMIRRNITGNGKNIHISYNLHVYIHVLYIFMNLKFCRGCAFSTSSLIKQENSVDAGIKILPSLGADPSPWASVSDGNDRHLLKIKRGFYL